MGLTCPLCHQSGISSEWHLRKHLEGKTGQHRLTPEKADETIAQAYSGSGSPAKRSKIYDSIIPLQVQAESSDEAIMQMTDPHLVFIEDLFSQLIANKDFPKYQFERRIDAIIAVFLPEIIKKHLGWDVEIISPEFPIKKSDNNQSTNVDYLLFRHGNNDLDDAWIFFELKTDCGSMRSEQWEIYVDAVERGMPVLLEGLKAIEQASRKSSKYNILDKCLDGHKKDCSIEILYLSPGEAMINGLPSNIHVIFFNQLAKLKLDKYSEVWDLFSKIVIPTLC